MDIHVVKPGDTLYSIALSHGVPMSRLLEDNQLPDPSRLVVGQTIVIQYPERTYVVRSGDTLFSIAQANGLTVKTLLRNNPSLAGEDRIFPGQELVLAYRQEKQGTLTVNGYAYPHIDRALLQRTLPYLSGLLPFSYEATALGELTPLDDVALVDAAKQMGVVHHEHHQPDTGRHVLAGTGPYHPLRSRHPGETGRQRDGGHPCPQLSGAGRGL